MIEIKNTGGDVRAVLIGDAEHPDNVKLLQPGESFVSDDAQITVNDGSSVRDRRSSDQQPYGRRVADPRTDQRQVNRASNSSASAGSRAGAQYSGGPIVDTDDLNNLKGEATDRTQQAGATTANVNNPAARGFQGTSATNTSDGTNVPKNASGEHLT